jgi:hypothetical protein
MRSSPLFFSGRHVVTAPKVHGPEPVVLYYGMWSATGKQLRPAPETASYVTRLLMRLALSISDDHDVASLIEPHLPYRHPVRVMTLPSRAVL